MLTITILFIILAIIIKKSAVIIPARQAGVQERLGKFEKVLNPGLHFLIPFADRVSYQHEIREQVIQVDPQRCISKDNIQMNVDGLIYIKVMDPRLASYGIENYHRAAMNLAQTTLRSELGKLDLHETFSERDQLNKIIVEEIDKASRPWGIKVLRYEIMNIEPSQEVVHALEKAMEAERDRRAGVTLATAQKEAVSIMSEGKRQEAINISEGERMKTINEAEGRAQEIKIVADATSYGVKRVAEAISKPCGTQAVSARITQQFIDGFGKIINTANMTVVPTQLANIKGFFAGLSEVSETLHHSEHKK